MSNRAGGEDENSRSTATEAGERELFRPDRLLAFSDGVFGVAITLLVIDIRLPSIATGSGDMNLLPRLAGLAPNLIVFAFTFVVIGMSWMGHHRKFAVIDQIDTGVLWINLLFLMALCLVPFASGVLAEYSRNQFAFALYAGVMAIVEMLSAALSMYSIRAPFLRASTHPRRRQRDDMIFSPLANAVIFAASSGFAILGLARVAHWLLLAIVPAMAFFGARSSRRESPARPKRANASSEGSGRP